MRAPRIRISEPDLSVVNHAPPSGVAEPDAAPQARSGNAHLRNPGSASPADRTVWLLQATGFPAPSSARQLRVVACAQRRSQLLYATPSQPTLPIFSASI